MKQTVHVIQVVFVLATLWLLWYAFNQAMFVVPPDAEQGPIQRIFYYHVSSAIVGMTCFFANFLASIWYLAVRKSHPGMAQKVDAYAVSTAEVGLLFCSLVLITGP